MKIKYDVISDVGRVRTNNEDMALIFGSLVRDNRMSSSIPMKKGVRFSALIADGMGGYGGGEIASEMVLDAFNDFLAELPQGWSWREVSKAIKDWLRGVQDSVLSRAASDPSLAHMGTTLTGIFTYDDGAYMINAGDSRVYRWRYDQLRQLTVDHSERNRTGDPTVPSNLIYNAIGVPGAFIDVTYMTEDLPIIDGDTYIICSDGLCDMIDDDTIAAILAQGGGARQLVDAALEAGGQDNCTVIMLKFAIPEVEETAVAEAKVEEAAPLAEPEPEPVAPADDIVLVEAPILPASGFIIDEIDEEVVEPKPEPEVKTEPTPPPFVEPEVKIISSETTETPAPGQPNESQVERSTRDVVNRLKEAWHVLTRKD